jgi:hypothetical protein
MVGEGEGIMDRMSEGRVKGTGRSTRRARWGGLVAGAMVASVVGAQLPIFAAGATIKATTVLVTPAVHTAGATTTYTFSFFNKTAMTTGSITLFAPTGTTLPGVLADYTVTQDATPVTVATVTVTAGAPSVTIDLTGKVTVTQTLLVTVKNVINTEEASATWRWGVADTTATRVTSPKVPIKGAAPAKSSILPASGTKVEKGLTTDVTVTAKATGAGTGTATAPRPVTGDVVTLTATPVTATIAGTTTGSTSVTNVSGVASFRVSSAKTGTVKVTATDQNNPSTAPIATTTIDFVATSVTTGKVVPTSSAAGATTKYRVSFKTSTVGLIPTGGTITLVAPAGTKFPAAKADYKVTTSTVSSVTVSTATAKAVIHVSPTAITADEDVTVTITHVVNPTTVKATDTMAIATTGDVTPANSADYAITAAPVSASRSTVSANPSSGTSTTQITVTLLDTFTNPVPGKTVTVTASSSAVVVTPAAPGSAVTNAEGIATFLATDPASGKVQFSATDTTDGITLTTKQTVTFKSPTSVTAVTAAVSTATVGKASNYTVKFTTSSNGAFSNGQIILTAHPGTTLPSCATVCGTVYKVTSGTAVKVVSQVVNLKATTSTTPNRAVISLAGAGITDSDAVTVVVTGATNLTLSNPGYVIVASTSADSAPVNSTTFTLVPTKADAATTQVSPNPGTVPADGLTQALVAVAVRDQFGNLVPNQTVKLTATGSSKAVITPSTSSSGTTGVALFAVTDATPQTVVVTATLTTPVSGTVTQTAKLKFTAPTLVSGVAVSLTNADADQYSQYTVTFKTSATGALGAGSSIAVSAPAGTDFSGTAAYYKVTDANGGTDTVKGVITFANAGSSTQNAAIISLSAAGIGDNDTVTVTVGFVANPAVGSSAYTISVGTSSDTSYPQASSSPYTIDGPGLVSGYWLVAADGGIFTYGKAAFHGSTGSIALVKPIVAMALTPDRQGYWLVASDGGIFAFGDAKFYGSMGGKPLNAPIVGMSATADGQGYWLVASDGGIFAFGDAKFYGSMGGKPLNKPIVGIATLPDGQGYYMVASDGGIFSFGAAKFYGSAGSLTLNKPIVAMAPTSDGQGYWLVATDGGIFNYGDAKFFGSAGSLTLNAPIVGMTPTADGKGYLLVASDGGIFNYGDAVFDGSAGALTLNSPIVGMAS